MATKNTPLDLEDEQKERAKYAGMLKEEIEFAASAVRTQQTKSAQIAGDLSGKLEIFEKKTGHKSALKTAVMVCNKEDADIADWMRSFLAYVDALGGNAQIDMFEQQKEQELNADSVEIASKSATVAASANPPSNGAEPTVN